MKISPRAASEIARLMRDPNALRHERELMPRHGGRGHYDPNQPRLPAGHPDGGQWTSTGAGLAANRIDSEYPKIAQFSPNHPPRTPIRPGHPLVAILSLFAALSARNSPNHRAIFEFNARQFLTDPSGALTRADVERLTRDQVGNICKRLEDVQEDTDDAARVVRRDGGWRMSPQQFGTAVHKMIKDVINGRDEAYLHAEVSRIKQRQADADYGEKGSVRIDVLEYAGDGTTCVYDIKTGESRRSGLSLARMRELAENALQAYPNTRRIIVTEVRLSR